MINFDFSEITAFVEAARQADFKKQMGLFMQGLGSEFLRIVQDEITDRDNKDTGDLLRSFSQGDKNNVWVLSDGGMTLEVGTILDYAEFVNDGHWTVNADTPGAFQMKDGTLARFVPGYWSGKKFVYDSGAKGGMVLKQKWVEGSHYWDTAVKVMEKLIPKYGKEMLEEWLQNYFKPFL